MGALCLSTTYQAAYILFHLSLYDNNTFIHFHTTNYTEVAFDPH